MKKVFYGQWIELTVASGLLIWVAMLVFGLLLKKEPSCSSRVRRYHTQTRRFATFASKI